MEINAPSGLTARVLDLGADTDPPQELVAGWMQSLTRGFLEGRATDSLRVAWRAQLVADRVRLTGLWMDTPRVADSALPVATFADWPGEISTGGTDGPVPLHMITDVTVAPTHRRRGLLRAMMTASLRDAAARGVPLAGLTVSEGSIYGRFGFGQATAAAKIEVDTSARFALRDSSVLGAGSVELVEPATAWPHVERIYDAFRRRTRGATTRPAGYADRLSARFRPEDDGPDRGLRGALHLSGSGEPDGYVLWRYVEESDKMLAEVTDLVAEGAAYLRLWRFLADLDLTERVRYDRARVEGDPLSWALVDPLVRRVTGADDMLWLRILDVSAALRARPWAADGVTSLRVSDPLDLVTGRYRVRTEDARATIDRLTDAPEPDDVVMDVETLGSLHLGAVTSATLHAAGRISGSEAAITTWCAQSDHAGPTGHSQSGF